MKHTEQKCTLTVIKKAVQKFIIRIRDFIERLGKEEGYSVFT